MRHSCRKAATPPMCSGVSVCCLWLCCRENGLGRAHPTPSLCREPAERAAPCQNGRGEAGSSVGSAASPDLLGLCGTSFPSKFLANAEQQLQNPLLGLSRGVSATPWARGAGRAALVLLCARLSWFGATGPNYRAAAPPGTAGRSVRFHPASPDFCSRGCPTDSTVPQTSLGAWGRAVPGTARLSKSDCLPSLCLPS